MNSDMKKFWINKIIWVFSILLIVGWAYWSFNKLDLLPDGLIAQGQSFFSEEETPPDVVVAAPMGVHVYPREWSTQQLGLTGRFKLDPDYEIMDATTVQPDIRKTTVISTFNVKDGTVETLVKPEKLSFLGFEDNKEIGMEYGLGRDGKSIGVYGRWDLLRTGSIRYGIYGNVDDTGDFKLVGRAFYRF
mgnify:CR=1 FL=1